VLVTGATGFVASHLVPALVSRGHGVLQLGHDTARIPEVDGAEPLLLDLSRPFDPDALPDADAVVHLAQANVPFPASAAELFAVNTASTACLLEYARGRGASRFVLASSASVYGFGDQTFVEDDPPRARDFYSATKLASERFVAAYSEQLGTTIFRLVAPYGPGQRDRLIPALVERIREARPITLNDGGRPRTNPIYVDDVVHAIFAALESPRGLVNVAGDEAVTIRDLGELIGQTLDIEPVYEQGDGGTPGDLVANNARLHAFAGDLVPLRDGLRRTVLAEAHA